jgi:hypothetical protein
MGHPVNALDYIMRRYLALPGIRSLSRIAGDPRTPFWKGLLAHQAVIAPPALSALAGFLLIFYAAGAR